MYLICCIHKLWKIQNGTACLELSWMLDSDPYRTTLICCIGWLLSQRNWENVSDGLVILTIWSGGGGCC